MGFYINELEDGTPLPKIGKADFLLEHIKPSIEWSRLPDNFDPVSFGYNNAVIAVVDNGLFDAAAYVDEHLFNRIKLEKEQGKPPRKTRFICMNRVIAAKLAGIEKYLE